MYIIIISYFEREVKRGFRIFWWARRSCIFGAGKAIRFCITEPSRDRNKDYRPRAGVKKAGGCAPARLMMSVPAIWTDVALPATRLAVEVGGAFLFGGIRIDVFHFSFSFLSGLYRPL